MDVNIPAEVKRWQGPHVIAMHGQPCGICGKPASWMKIDGDRRTVVHIPASASIRPFDCVR